MLDNLDIFFCYIDRDVVILEYDWVYLSLEKIINFLIFLIC